MQSAICFVSFTVLFFLGRPATFNCLIHLLRLNQLIVEPFLELKCQNVAYSGTSRER